MFSVRARSKDDTSQVSIERTNMFNQATRKGKTDRIIFYQLENALWVYYY